VPTFGVRTREMKVEMMGVPPTPDQISGQSTEKRDV
jgi:hypothetical protein